MQELSPPRSSPRSHGGLDKFHEKLIDSHGGAEDATLEDVLADRGQDDAGVGAEDQVLSPVVTHVVAERAQAGRVVDWNAVFDNVDWRGVCRESRISKSADKERGMSWEERERGGYSLE